MNELKQVLERKGKKLIYVMIPVVDKIKKAYVVDDEQDLDVQLLKDHAAFMKQAVWYANPERVGNTKELYFHEMNENW